MATQHIERLININVLLLTHLHGHAAYRVLIDINVLLAVGALAWPRSTERDFDPLHRCSRSQAPTRVHVMPTRTHDHARTPVLGQNAVSRAHQVLACWPRSHQHTLIERASIRAHAAAHQHTPKLGTSLLPCHPQVTSARRPEASIQNRLSEQRTHSLAASHASRDCGGWE
jgi:hypothetical protein